MVANSTFLWPYNWPLDWPIWCNLLTEGVVSYEELGNAKKALSKKCASSVHPKNATEFYCDNIISSAQNSYHSQSNPLHYCRLFTRTMGVPSPKASTLTLNRTCTPTPLLYLWGLPQQGRGPALTQSPITSASNLSNRGPRAPTRGHCPTGASD